MKEERNTGDDISVAVRKEKTITHRKCSLLQDSRDCRNLHAEEYQLA